jgi:hypothetical protein
MFELVAIIAALGVADATPVATLHNRHTFPTIEACMNYGDTEKGAIEKNMVVAMAKDASTESGTQYEAKFSCVPLKPKDDGSL